MLHLWKVKLYEVGREAVFGENAVFGKNRDGSLLLEGVPRPEEVGGKSVIDILVLLDTLLETFEVGMLEAMGKW